MDTRCREELDEEEEEEEEEEDEIVDFEAAATLGDTLEDRLLDMTLRAALPHACFRLRSRARLLLIFSCF